MLVQLPGVFGRDDPSHKEREQPERVLPMAAHLLHDRMVVHVDLLDADPETVSVALDGDALIVTAARVAENGADARYAQELSLERKVERDRVRVHDGVVTVMLDLRDGDDRAGSSARR